MGVSVSAAIVTYCDSVKAERATRSILEHSKKYPVDFYIFDNGSPDNAKPLEAVNGVKVLPQHANLGFGKAHNLILKQEIGDYHFLVNPDITVNEDVIGEIVDFMEQNPDIVMMMPQITNPDGTIQYLPKEMPTFRRLFLGRLSKKIRTEFTWSDRVTSSVTDIDFCSGCFFCIRGEAFKKLGGFDERYFMYLEDVDLTQRAKKLGRVVINPQIPVVHDWERTSAKSLKYLMIHTTSALKFLLRKRKF